MNEILFAFHLLLILTITWAARHFGRDALMGWVILQPILANLFVLKQVVLFGFHVTCSDVYAVSAILGVNFIQEYYGKEPAKRTVWHSMLAMLFFVAMSMLHLSYEPSNYDISHGAYKVILEQSPRLFVASMLGFLLVQQIDIHLFAFLKEKLPHVPFRLRNLMSLTVSQIFDTFFFTIFGLSGIVCDLVDIFILSAIIKCSIAWYLALFSPAPKKAAS